MQCTVHSITLYIAFGFIRGFTTRFHVTAVGPGTYYARLRGPACNMKQRNARVTGPSPATSSQSEFPSNFTVKCLRRLIQPCFTQLILLTVNTLTPNDTYTGRTAPLTSKRCILYIYSTNIGTEYFKHDIYSPFFFLFKMQFVSQF